MYMALMIPAQSDCVVWMREGSYDN